MTGWEVTPRLRVVSDNDYCGDPDGLVQLAHLLLCDSAEVPLVISSAVGTAHFEWTPDCPERGAREARRVAELAGRPEVRVAAGSPTPMPSAHEPARSEAVDALIAEAMRDDTDLPLFLTCGGGLTAVASAYLIEPRIADRLTLVWIGGEKPGTTDLPDDVRWRETNTNIDLTAARVVFDSPIPLWQVPAGVYDAPMVSRAEWATRVRPHGPLGTHLFDVIAARVDMLSRGINLGETYCMGDNPLVLLTALTGSYSSTPSTSTWVDLPRPRLDARGLAVDNPDGSPMRRFTGLDVRLLLEDFYARVLLRAGAAG